jgi:hypothetical protein
MGGCAEHGRYGAVERYLRAKTRPGHRRPRSCGDRRRPTPQPHFVVAPERKAPKAASRRKQSGSRAARTLLGEPPSSSAWSGLRENEGFPLPDRSQETSPLRSSSRWRGKGHVRDVQGGHDLDAGLFECAAFEDDNGCPGPHLGSHKASTSSSSAATNAEMPYRPHSWKRRPNRVASARMTAGSSSSPRTDHHRAGWDR